MRDGKCRCISLPEVNTGCALVNIRRIDTADAALAEEDAHERGIPFGGPVPNGEDERIGQVLWGIRKLQVAIK